MGNLSSLCANDAKADADDKKSVNSFRKIK
jgi:hypothetical protein